MPFYDLCCPKCGKEYNIPATIAEKTEKRIPCPDCGASKCTLLERRIAALKVAPALIEKESRRLGSEE